MSGATPPVGVVRQPRLRLLANGMPLPWPIQAMVRQTNTWTAATWSAEAALKPPDPLNAAWWSAQANVEIEIQIALDGVTFQSLLIGVIDEIEIAPDEGLLTISGRDLTALLIDQKISNAYQNQTASEIATLLAQAAGLTPVVTATTTPVGQFYTYDHVRMALGDLEHAITEWDLLVYLAQQSGYDVFVEGRSLYFQPPTAAKAPTFTVNWSAPGGVSTSNVIGLNMRRSLTLAKNVEVTVKSWHSGRRYPTVVRISSSPVNAPNGGLGPKQSYVFYKANLTPAQATAYANAKMAAITRHERVIDFSLPLELSLTPRGIVQLTGTGTAFDQLYYPDEIERSIHARHGTSQTVTARNHSPVQQTVLY
ncbi:MAG: hypothetical protein B7Z75_14430 [Acidocella sp. 20-57-95]|uniref:hypothetical protein n=1 Tax=Acidiphilium sp. TaxID=527 RepID=UPI000BCFB85F|nr:hypothetical protein [Acidiphilium sp.]OYV42037.1 MAG: hypothetical protein B7Z75_14430 [Acidocella sp. 20-57-95]HQT62777.1 hypothetical protein [Acidiphilium sp.]